MVVPGAILGEECNRIYIFHMCMSMHKAMTRKLVFRTSNNVSLAALVEPCGVFKRNVYYQPSVPLILRLTPIIMQYEGEGRRVPKRGENRVYREARVTFARYDIVV